MGYILIGFVVILILPFAVVGIYESVQDKRRMEIIMEALNKPVYVFKSKHEYDDEAINPLTRNDSFNKPDKPKLLTIELDNIDSVPVVRYNGEDIGAKIRVVFDYQTNTEYFNPTRIKIEHADRDSEKPNIILIQHN
jgi:hypothetical protein